MISVLHILSTDKYSGAEKVAEQICKNLDNRHFNTRLICHGSLATQLQDLTVINLNVNNLKNLWQFKKIIKPLQINIVHTHGLRAGLFALTAKWFFRLPYKTISHVHHTCPWLSLKCHPHRIIDRLTRNSFDINLLCAKQVETAYLTYGTYIRKSSIRTVSNAIELDPIIYNPERVSNLKAQFKNEFIFGFIGAFEARKALIPFIKTLSQYPEILQKARLLMIGDGIEFQQVTDLINQSNLHERIILLGHQSQAIDYLNIMDILLLPSAVEGLPMVVLEAMAVAKPVLAFNVGSLSELISHNKNGFLLSPQDYPAFIHTMKKIQTQPDQLKKLGESARQTIIKNLGLPQFIKKIEDIYRVLI